MIKTGCFFSDETVYHMWAVDGMRMSAKGGLTGKGTVSNASKTGR